MVGTLYYMPPESFSSEGYSHKVNVCAGNTATRTFHSHHVLAFCRATSGAWE
jgi:serine/threonine protein kinase